MDETLQVTMNEATHRFEVRLGDATAFAEYVLHNGAIVFPHTVVPTAFEGRGIGSLLIRTGLAYAREHGLKVKPSCPFFAACITKHPEWHDLVHPDYRARLGLD